MKSLRLSVLFIFGVLILEGQNKPSSSSIKVELPTSIVKQNIGLDVVEIPITNHNTNSNEVSDIKAAHWDTAVYNPYKDVAVAYPIALEFTDTSYASPIKRKKVITSRYGWRWGRPHKGIDIDLITGDSVFSVLDGIVRFARYSSGHGRTVVIRHFNGLETTYAHLSRFGVKANDTVRKGEYIGKGGNTGRSYGSHLHFETRYKGVHIHPEYLFSFDDTNSIRSEELWVTKKWTRPGYHSSRRASKLALYTTEEEAIASTELEPKVYVVKRGDTLSRISQRNNVTVAAICRTNSIKRNSTLRIGQKLIIEP